jgi:hypothetical protein
VALCAIVIASSQTGMSAAGSLPLRPGRYAGTVSMSPVYPGGSTTSVTVTGTWSASVSSRDRVTGRESLSGTVTLVPTNGCTDTPPTYTLTLIAALGQNLFGHSSPGKIQGSHVTIPINTAKSGLGWSASPSSVDFSCGSGSESTPILLAYGDTGAPIYGYTANLPLGLFKTRGHPYAVKVENSEGHLYTQVYILHSAP